MSKRMTVAKASERAWASGSDGEPETWVEELREAAQVLADEMDRLRADAERYRYVRDKLAYHVGTTMNDVRIWSLRVRKHFGSTFDEAIDRAIAEDAGK